MGGDERETCIKDRLRCHGRIAAHEGTGHARRTQFRRKRGARERRLRKIPLRAVRDRVSETVWAGLARHGIARGQCSAEAGDVVRGRLRTECRVDHTVLASGGEPVVAHAIRGRDISERPVGVGTERVRDVMGSIGHRPVRSGEAVKLVESASVTGTPRQAHQIDDRAVRTRGRALGRQADRCRKQRQRRGDRQERTAHIPAVPRVPAAGQRRDATGSTMRSRDDARGAGINWSSVAPARDQARRPHLGNLARVATKRTHPPGHAQDAAAGRAALGRRIRELRRARGLTQADLAGTDIPRSFISRLENGRAHLDAQRARLLAHRLGVEHASILAGAGTRPDTATTEALTQAEQCLRTGDRAGALEIIREWMPRVNGLARARLARLHAQLLLDGDQEDAVRAIALLEEALTTFEGRGLLELAVRTRFALARAHARRYDHARSDRSAFEAAAALARGDVTDRTLELDIEQFLAASYWSRGDLASARIRAERARAWAEDIADPGALADMHYLLALTHHDGGDDAAAVVHANAAVAVYGRLGRPRFVARTLNTLGWLLIQTGEHERAAAALDRAETTARSSKQEALLPWIALNRGALALAGGAVGAALEVATRLITTDAPARLRVRALLLRARALAHSGAATEEIGAAFETALSAGAGESVRERVRAHRLFADALAERGAYERAVTEMRKAAELAGLGTTGNAV